MSLCLFQETSDLYVKSMRKMQAIHFIIFNNYTLTTGWTAWPRKSSNNIKQVDRTKKVICYELFPIIPPQIPHEYPFEFHSNTSDLKNSHFSTSESWQTPSETIFIQTTRTKDAKAQRVHEEFHWEAFRWCKSFQYRFILCQTHELHNETGRAHKTLLSPSHHTISITESHTTRKTFPRITGGGNITPVHSPLNANARARTPLFHL